MRKFVRWLVKGLVIKGRGEREEGLLRRRSDRRDAGADWRAAVSGPLRKKGLIFSFFLFCSYRLVGSIGGCERKV